MAQLNTRVKDESKEKAEPILEAAGHTFSSYISGLVDYIAETGSLPFQIRYKPAAVNPQEVFSEALQRFKTVWGRLKHFTQSAQPGQSLPDKAVAMAMKDIEEAYGFYRNHEALILSAPGQRTGSPAGGFHHYPASLDGVNRLSEVLRLAAGNLTSLAVLTPEHLQITRGFIDEAAGYINALQKFGGGPVSGNTLNQMIIRDSREAIVCAREALAQNDKREGIPLYTFTMWFERFRKHLASIRSMQLRVGASDSTAALTDLCEQLTVIDVYLERDEALRHGKISGYTPNDELIVLAEAVLETFRTRAGDQPEFIAGSTESPGKPVSRIPAD
ncbi:type II toxin-antitoxin system RelB/DinJ family antitoxin [Scandinavium sp.]|uniref:type II toxin-antitoxin system RelB/DinJ family antitoxin n=1 Tax=Scandinavium sp. TaxID=2830653 RepID=UPI0028A0F502|nr:type II toxin-antitoxin system RelB/DinJ family antitoxin [Scandinavium sp.]